jgi:hypothetical protein
MIAKGLVPFFGIKVFAIMKIGPPAEGHGAEKCYAIGATLLYSSRRYGAAIRHVFAR